MSIPLRIEWIGCRAQLWAKQIQSQPSGSPGRLRSKK